MALFSSNCCCLRVKNGRSLASYVHCTTYNVWYLALWVRRMKLERKHKRAWGRERHREKKTRLEEWTNVMHTTWTAYSLCVAWNWVYQRKLQRYVLFMLPSWIAYTQYTISYMYWSLWRILICCIFYARYELLVVVCCKARQICASGEPYTNNDIRMGMVYNNLWCFFFVFIFFCAVLYIAI